jgi:putative transposase
MANYQRIKIEGATYFFTVNLLERQSNTLLVQKIDTLREVVRKVKAKYPFHIDAWVVLPEHLHAMWTLPADDCNYSLRWRLIKNGFSRALPKIEHCSPIRQAAGERGIWQRHFLEHCIRDEADYQHHLDYIHINPLKHGLVSNVKDWPYSSFHRYVADGTYSINWCGDEFIHQQPID